MFVKLYQIEYQNDLPYGLTEILINTDNIKCCKPCHKNDERILNAGKDIYMGGDLWEEGAVGEYSTLICFMKEKENEGIEVVEDLDYILSICNG